MVLKMLGKIAEQYWLEIPKHFTNTELDYFVIMQNHIHGILIINSKVETRHASSLRTKSITLSILLFHSNLLFQK